MTTAATAGERKALAELLDLFDQAKGNHSALADVRSKIAAQIDSTVAGLASFGVDTDALLDELDAEAGR